MAVSCSSGTILLWADVYACAQLLDTIYTMASGSWGQWDQPGTGGCSTAGPLVQFTTTHPIFNQSAFVNQTGLSYLWEYATPGNLTSLKSSGRVMNGGSSYSYQSYELAQFVSGSETSQNEGGLFFSATSPTTRTSNPLPCACCAVWGACQYISDANYADHTPYLRQIVTPIDPSLGSCANTYDMTTPAGVLTTTRVNYFNTPFAYSGGGSPPATTTVTFAWCGVADLPAGSIPADQAVTCTYTYVSGLYQLSAISIPLLGYFGTNTSGVLECMVEWVEDMLTRLTWSPCTAIHCDGFANEAAYGTGSTINSAFCQAAVSLNDVLQQQADYGAYSTSPGNFLACYIPEPGGGAGCYTVYPYTATNSFSYCSGSSSRPTVSCLNSEQIAALSLYCSAMLQFQEVLNYIIANIGTTLLPGCLSVNTSNPCAQSYVSPQSCPGYIAIQMNTCTGNATSPPDPCGTATETCLAQATSAVCNCEEEGYTAYDTTCTSAWPYNANTFSGPVGAPIQWATSTSAASVTMLDPDYSNSSFTIGVSGCGSPTGCPLVVGKSYCFSVDVTDSYTSVTTTYAVQFVASGTSETIPFGPNSDPNSMQMDGAFDITPDNPNCGTANIYISNMYLGCANRTGGCA